jgi:hypothetical protein
MVLAYGHFHNADCTNPLAWETFPSSDVFFDFFLKWFIVVIDKVLGFLIKFIPRYFISFEAIVNRIFPLIS